MKYLPVKDWLNEDTRLQTVVLHHENGVYDLHRGRGDDSSIMYITKHGEPTKILMMCTEDLWNMIFNGQ